jgi:CheY-like chemotaxis protein
LVLADVKMKGMSGIELYEHLGKTDQSMQRRVVFITGDTLARDTRDFLEKTKAPCISKPFDVEHIKERVNLMLAKM